MSYFLFNKLYILQSLADNDRKTGKELEERINTFSLSNNINFQAVLFDLHSKEEWEYAWKEIYTSIDQLNIIPIIHLVMHGNTDYIGIEQGVKGLIGLSELFEKTRKANILSHNNIMLTMAVCEGLNVIRFITLDRPMPFCNILASQETLCNPISLENFTIFYQALLKDGNIDMAFERLQNQGAGEMGKYRLVKSEQLFANVMQMYLDNKCNDQAIEERAEEIAAMGKFDISDPIAKKNFVERVKEFLPEENSKGYEIYADRFFMFDLFPAIKNRFSIPKTFDEFLEWSKSFNKASLAGFVTR